MVGPVCFLVQVPSFDKGTVRSLAPIEGETQKWKSPRTQHSEEHLVPARQAYSPHSAEAALGWSNEAEGCRPVTGAGVVVGLNITERTVEQLCDLPRWRSPTPRYGWRHLAGKAEEQLLPIPIIGPNGDPGHVPPKAW